MEGVCLQYKEQRGEAQGKFRKGCRDQITQQLEGQKKKHNPVDFPLYFILNSCLKILLKTVMLNVSWYVYLGELEIIPHFTIL